MNPSTGTALWKGKRAELEQFEYVRCLLSCYGAWEIKVSLFTFLNLHIYMNSHITTHNHTPSDKLQSGHLVPALIIPQWRPPLHQVFAHYHAALLPKDGWDKNRNRRRDERRWVCVCGGGGSLLTACLSSLSGSPPQTTLSQVAYRWL